MNNSSDYIACPYKGQNYFEFFILNKIEIEPSYQLYSIKKFLW